MANKETVKEENTVTIDGNELKESELTDQQKYFAIHLPALTDVKKGEDSISEFYTEMVLKIIQ